MAGDDDLEAEGDDDEADELNVGQDDDQQTGDRGSSSTDAGRE